MNQHIFIVLILFAMVTVEKVSAFPLKRLIDQNREGPSQLHNVYSLRYQTTRSPYGFRDQQQNQRMYRTTSNPNGEGRFITRVTPNPNTPYGSYYQGGVTKKYGYGYPAATDRPNWYKPNSEYRSTNSPYGYRRYYYGGWTTQSTYYGSNLGPRPVSVTRNPYWGLRKDITTNNDLSEYSDDIDENNLSGEDYYGADDYSK
jgi:hypothetical protein